jgi:hypothetical protein
MRLQTKKYPGRRSYELFVALMLLMLAFTPGCREDSGSEAEGTIGSTETAMDGQMITELSALTGGAQAAGTLRGRQVDLSNVRVDSIVGSNAFFIIEGTGGSGSQGGAMSGQEGTATTPGGTSGGQAQGGQTQDGQTSGGQQPGNSGTMGTGNATDRVLVVMSQTGSSGTATPGAGGQASGATGTQGSGTTGGTGAQGTDAGNTGQSGTGTMGVGSTEMPMQGDTVSIRGTVEIATAQELQQQYGVSAMPLGTSSQITYIRADEVMQQNEMP